MVGVGGAGGRVGELGVWVFRRRVVLVAAEGVDGGISRAVLGSGSWNLRCWLLVLEYIIKNTSSLLYIYVSQQPGSVGCSLWETGVLDATEAD